jgi:hypothetical protein
MVPAYITPANLIEIAISKIILNKAAKLKEKVSYYYTFHFYLLPNLYLIRAVY